ncbi:3-keto-5-aminohexanoate cleavage protein, partial [Arthrospira platensis SPKY1]|nr:3-keto-5-aminohexanoate cleavage protein [Arthrospira platensis SPKY1]
MVPELECFDLGMINYGLYLIREGILEGPYYWNLIFGNVAGFQADASHVGIAVNAIPKAHCIGLGGFAGDQLRMNSLAIAMGYGVRVGIEDNIWWDASRTRLASNVEL